jgi:iron complex transport system substrate-binding protein
MRICSFLPSATEIVYALGLGEDLVGVTYTCDFPLRLSAGGATQAGGGKHPHDANRQPGRSRSPGQ